ncbi:hypothetical protein [Actinoplanes palleronii]|uniref:hypothetical protein n=1 Tax=Actinoplanes palleronii TaxID=113570 RepID=UPI001945440A|nr:hypothetical protein [Actinoplanes palleronii]
MSACARLVALVLVAGLTGCGSEQAPGSTAAVPTTEPGTIADPPSPAPAATASPAIGPPAADNPPGLITCGLLGAAIRDASLMQPGVVRAIADASATADAPVGDAATTLAQAYDIALASHDSGDEPDAIAAVSAAAADMAQVCADSGLDAVN